MTTEEAIKILDPETRRETMKAIPVLERIDADQEACRLAIAALRAQQKAEKEEGRYRFYYCESEDSYLLGARVDNFYYAHWDGKSFVWDMSRYLPWGEHIVMPETAWKEHTFPSEPKEIGPEEWFRGFLDQRFRQEAEKNEPLTLEELREMDGDPVWVTPGNFWALVRVVDKLVILVASDGERAYAGAWIKLMGPIYRRKPEEGAE